MEMKNNKNNKINYHETKFIDQKGHQQTIKIPVVQDLARLKILPENFIREAVAAHDPFPPAKTELESIDIGKLRAKSDPTEIRKLGRVCREWGMFMIQNHGLDQVLEAVEQVVNKFFDLPFEEKKSSVGTYMSTDNMGYGRNFVKSLHQPLDWIDRLTIKAAPVGATDGLRVWPNNPPNFRPVIENYVKVGRELLDEVLEALAEAISVDTRSFSQYFDVATSEVNVRVNCYPPSPRPDLTMGIVPHTDASALTLLTQFQSSNGLQLYKDNQWITVQWPCKTLLVNVGDFIEIISNGRFKSSWHRAVTQSNTARLSVALFYNPSAQLEIGPVNDREPIKYKKVMVGEYLDHFYKVSPTATKEAIMFSKLN